MGSILKNHIQLIPSSKSDRNIPAAGKIQNVPERCLTAWFHGRGVVVEEELVRAAAERS